jgi:hypothetical protein
MSGTPLLPSRSHWELAYWVLSSFRDGSSGYAQVGRTVLIGIPREPVAAFQWGERRMVLPRR